MKTPKIRTLIALVAVLGLLGATTAKATIVIDLSVTPYVQFGGASNPTSAEIAAALGITEAQLGSLLYKINNDGTEDGSLAGSYNGSVTTVGQSSTAVINWNGPQVANATYLLVKDGTEGSIVWDLIALPGGWDGKETIQIGDVFGQHAISHVEFFGNIAPVPEPTTMIAGGLLLLPFALSTLRMMRRKRTA